jgi:hypothetical protein
MLIVMVLIVTVLVIIMLSCHCAECHVSFITMMDVIINIYSNFQDLLTILSIIFHSTF